MPAVTEQLRHVLLKVQRAKKHISDFEAERRTFLDAEPYKVGTNRDPKTRELFYYIASVEDTPECLPLIAGDAIQNLMSALDHLAFQLVSSDCTGNPPVPDKIYFPIGYTSTHYTRAFVERKMQGGAQATFDAIDIIEPYKGGKGHNLWVLNRLNNIEKHRLLLTVGSKVAGVDVIQDFVFLYRNVYPELSAAFSQQSAVYSLADDGFPLKAGFVLARYPADTEANPNAPFVFDVALDESGILKSKSLLVTLHELATLVEHIINNLSPLLRDFP